MVFWSSLRRLAHIIRVFVGHALAHAAGALAWRCSPRLARRLRLSRLGGPERLRLMLEETGGTFIKFGQMLALQPDIISLEYCNALFNLLDRVAPFGYEQVERTFLEELGRPPSEIFDSFEREPLATASIGQVHVARLGGRKLAVKVQRPEVEKDFSGDVSLMSATMWLIRRLRLRFLYWVLEPVGEFVAWTREELDYRNEGRYMERLRRNARDNPRERVPAVLWELTTRRTLVAEFLEGETLLSYLRSVEAGDELKLRRMRDAGFDADEVARGIIDNFLGDVFRCGMFHADLHPANLMILPGNAVGYIDFGITGMISHYSRRNLIALTLAYTRGDLRGMCDAFFRVSVAETARGAEDFRVGLRGMADGWYEAEGKERRLRKNFTLVMLDMLRLSRRTGVWPERDVVKYIRSAIAIDGLITRFAPTFNLGAHLQAVCDRHLRWGARRAFLNWDTAVGWTASGGSLADDGALRLFSFMDKMARGEVKLDAEAEGRARDEDLRHRALRLASLVFAVSLLVAFAGGGASAAGINLLTAELLLAASAALMLLRTLRRLA